MNWTDLLEKRRSIRNFEDKPVPAALLKEIIGDSIKAPNVSNKPAWNFIIINNNGYMQKLADTSRQGFIDSVERNPNSPLKEYAIGLKGNKQANFSYNAPYLVYITGPTSVSTIREDVELLAAYFMFSATAARGLGTCWIGMGGVV